MGCVCESSASTEDEECSSQIDDAWRRSRRLFELVNLNGDLFDEALSLETAVFVAPIVSKPDVVAKLKAVRLVFREGPRSDGADAAALEQAIRWLEAR